MKEIETKFTKEQLLKSKKYTDRKDIVNVLLKDGQTYSFSEVDALIKKYMKGKVK
jgi:hypothetical protein